MAIDQTSLSFKTEFAVEMTCQACVDDVNGVLAGQGLDSVEVDLPTQRVTVIGRTPPSVLCRILKDTGKQVIVRGSGMASGSHEGAAVAILETPLPALQPLTSTEESQQVHGIARMVQISNSPILMLLDLTVRFPGYPLKAPSSAPIPSYDVYVAKTGDLTSPPDSTGGVHLQLTTITPDPETGYADAFCELPVPLWEVIGRGMVVEASEDVKKRQERSKVLQAEQKVKSVIGSNGRLGILAGVIARSAGAWGNEKTVCACSGKTMFEESRLMDTKVKV